MSTKKDNPLIMLRIANARIKKCVVSEKDSGIPDYFFDSCLSEFRIFFSEELHYQLLFLGIMILSYLEKMRKVRSSIMLLLNLVLFPSLLALRKRVFWRFRTLNLAHNLYKFRNPVKTQLLDFLHAGDTVTSPATTLVGRIGK